MTRLFIPWAQVVGDANIPIIDRAQAARRVACSVRQQRPWLFNHLIAPSLSPPGQVLNPAGRYYWDRLCPDIPLPAASVAQDAPPFFGGQCPVDYRLDYLAREKSGAVAGSGTVVLRGAMQVCHGTVERTSATQEAGCIYYQAPTHNGGVLVRNTFGIRNVGILQRVEFTLTRVDGLPDVCGNNPGTIVIPAVPPPNNVTIPINWDGQTRPVTVNLPEFETGDWPNFTFEPVFEVEGSRYEFLPDGLGIEFNPRLNLPGGGNFGGDQINNIDSTVGDIISIVTDIEQIVSEQSTPNMSVSIPFSECGSEPQSNNVSGELPTVLGIALSQIATNLDAVGKRVCETSAVIPDWWQARVPQVGQAVMLLADIAEGSTSRWSMAIPHYNMPQDFFPELTFSKGSWLAKMTLRDNSKVYGNFQSIAEAERVIGVIRGWIDPSFIDEGSEIQISKRRGSSLSEKTVKIQRVSMFSTGQLSTVPDWVKYAS